MLTHVSRLLFRWLISDVGQENSSVKFLVFLVFSVLGVAAFAGWKDRPGVDAEYKSSAIVFLGEVTGSKDVREPDDFVRGNFYTIRVHEVSKGKPQASVEVYSENTSGRFPMDVGASYLVFASEQTFEGIDGPRLAINAAGNSGLLKDAGEALLVVHKLNKQSPNQAPEPTPVTVTPRADARVAPVPVVAHL